MPVRQAWANHGANMTKSRCRCGPSPGADVGRVPAQMWQGVTSGSLGANESRSVSLTERSQRRGQVGYHPYWDTMQRDTCVQMLTTDYTRRVLFGLSHICAGTRAYRRRVRNPRVRRVPRVPRVAQPRTDEAALETRRPKPELPSDALTFSCSTGSAARGSLACLEQRGAQRLASVQRVAAQGFRRHAAEAPPATLVRASSCGGMRGPRGVL
jgi:hypothetical protein